MIGGSMKLHVVYKRTIVIHHYFAMYVQGSWYV